LAHARIIASSITAHQFNPWVLDQPPGQGFSFSIRQKVHWYALLKIDEDCAISSAAAKRKIVHSQHARRGMRGFLRRVDQPEQRIWAAEKLHAFYQLAAGFPTTGESNEREEIL
jgi:hypothetical protein